MPVVHVGVPDGETLWLAVEADPSDQLALRDVHTHQLTPIPSNTDRGLPSVQSARFSLMSSGRPRLGDDLEVVVRHHASGELTPVGFCKDARDDKRIPRTPGGQWRFRVQGVEGRMRLSWVAEAPCAPIVSIDASASEMVVQFTAPDGVAPVVAAVDDGNALVGEVSCVPEGSLLTLTLDDDTFDIRPGATVSLVVDPSRRTPLVRSHDDLAFPNYSVVLPTLIDSKSEDEPGLTLRYKRDGSLALHRPASSGEADL